MYSVKSGGITHTLDTARDAASKARLLRRDGANDVEIFRSNGERISLYALDQLVRTGDS